MFGTFPELRQNLSLCLSSHLSLELPGAPSNLVISNISPRSATLQFRPGYDGKTSISRWIVEGQVCVSRRWGLGSPRSGSGTEFDRSFAVIGQQLDGADPGRCVGWPCLQENQRPTTAGVLGPDVGR